MRLFGLFLFCVTLLSAQGLPTKAELEERLRNLQNAAAQLSAQAEDSLRKALEAAKASGDTAKAEELTKSLDRFKASGSSTSTGINSPASAAAMASSTTGWSYMLLRFTISNKSLNEVDQLNTAGQRGYELVSVVQAGDERLFYLKRRAQ